MCVEVQLTPRLQLSYHLFLMWY